MTFWYLGSPYSKYPTGLYDAFFQACRARGLLVRAGILCFCPVVHSHNVAEICGMDPRSHAIWMPSERPIMEAAMGLIVLKLEGWDESVGLAEEIDFFREKNLPVVYMEPGVVPAEVFG